MLTIKEIMDAWNKVYGEDMTSEYSGFITELEKIVVKKFPIVKKILNELKQNNNCQLSRLTGSGSACFGLFLTKKSAKLGLKKIKKKFPRYWCVTSKTI